MPPGSGWPGDPAVADTPVAATSEEVRRLAAGAADAADLSLLTAEVSVCRACPRLVAWREDVAVRKRASYAGEPYWGRPIHGWGAPSPSVLVVGLAPAANGGNRTGRIFTGDRSGDWLVASMHRVGLATQATSEHAADGLELIDTRMVAAVRCAPPQNRPTPEERDTCAGWLDHELAMVASSLRVVVVLGGFGWDAALGAFRRLGWALPPRKPRFGHGVEVEVRPPGHSILLLGCYHPSQQNTFTGRLTEPMLDEVLGRAATEAHRQR